MERKIKPKKCRNCGEKFSPNKSTTVACSYTCALNLARKKVIEEGFKELKEKVKTLSQYEAEAKTVFQRWVRLRDKDKPCISCGTIKCDEWAGGHFYPAGVYSGLMFDERNCHKQCNQYCNMHLSSNPHEYRKGLIKRYGQSFVDELDLDANIKRSYKYTKDELIEIKKTYQTKIKQLTK